MLIMIGASLLIPVFLLLGLHRGHIQQPRATDNGLRAVSQRPQVYYDVWSFLPSTPSITPP